MKGTLQIFILKYVRGNISVPTSNTVCSWEARFTLCGPGSSVDIATELRAGRSGIESRWGRDFPPIQTGPRAHPASCTMDTESFSGVKCGRGVLLTTHPLLVPRSWKSRAIPPPSRPHRACNGIILPFIYTHTHTHTHIYIYIYIYISIYRWCVYLLVLNI